MSVGCTLHACPETHPCPCTLISVLRSGWFDSCDTALHGISPSCPPISAACLYAFVLAVGICLTAAFFLSFKKPLELPAKKLLVCLQKKTNMHEAAQARKEVAPPTTRAFDNLKTDADRKHERLQACKRHLHGGALVFRGRLHRVSRHRHCAGQAWREGGSAR